MSTQIAIGWWKYNPILNKPSTLEPLVPWSWFYYYGPDPSAGSSYGCYVDKESQVAVITTEQTPFSPITGKKMDLIAQYPDEEVKAALGKATAHAFYQVYCSKCKSDLCLGNIALHSSKLHCIKCGEANSIVQKEKVMKEDSAKALREKVKAIIAKKRAAKASSEQELIEKVKAKLAAKKAEKAKAEQEDEWVPLEEVIKSVGADKEAAPEEKKPEEAAPEEKKPEEAAPAPAPVAEEKKPEEAAPAPAPVAEEKPADESVPQPKEEEFIDLDMVLSALKKEERRERIRERVIAARKRTLARRTATAEEAKKEEEMKEEAKKEEAAKKAKAEETAAPAPMADKEPDMVSQENPDPAPVSPAVKELAEALKFEPVASLERLAAVKPNEVDMILYGEDTENPTWSVAVAGIPACRIQLKAQASAEQIRQVFCSEDYASDLMAHVAKAGFLPTMKTVKAEFWAHFLDDNARRDRFKKEAEQAVANVKRDYLASFQGDFMNCLNVVVAGMNKNYYPEVGNPLKDSLFASMKLYGMPDQSAVTIIERAFKESSAAFFESLFSKASDYMNLTKETRAEIAKAITDSNPIERYVESEAFADEGTLGQRVAKASVLPQMTSGAGSLDIRNTKVTMDTEEYKQQLRASWKRR